MVGGQLDALAIEMLCGLIDDLNARNRFAGLPLPPPGNAAGVAQACGWLTGFPFRVGFGRGRPSTTRGGSTRHAWSTSGEADAALWIARSAAPAAWHADRCRLVALAPPGTRFATPPAVAITVGRPGVDHDAVLYHPALGTLVARAAERRAQRALGGRRAAAASLAALPC